jgi:hypothetical protein
LRGKSGFAGGRRARARGGRRGGGAGGREHGRGCAGFGGARGWGFGRAGGGGQGEVAAVIAFRVAFAQKGKGFERFQAILTRSIAKGLNEGGDKVRTQVARSLFTQTGVKNGNYGKSILSRMRIAKAYAVGSAPKSGIGPSRGASLTYQIIVMGKPIMKLEEFPVSVTAKGVDARTWGVDHLFQRSFFLAGKANPYRARLGKERFPVRGLKGPNLAKELDRGDTPKRFILYSRLYVGPAILKHIAKGM